MAKTFQSHNPVTGDVLGKYPIASKSEVNTAVAQAAVAFERWSRDGFAKRRKVLLAYSRAILDRIDDLAQLVTLETGKPHSDAKLEIALAAHHIAWAARNADSVLRVSHRSPGLLMANMSATVERSPLGVVGVIGPLE